MDSNTIREKIQQIFARHGTGDLPDRPFRRAMAEYTARLYTAVAQERLRAGESIVQEHHVIRSHMALTQSVLKDPQQEIISLFVTERRLIRLRSVLTPGRPVTCDRRDGTIVDDLPFGDIEALRVHREVRLGGGHGRAGPGRICLSPIQPAQRDRPHGRRPRAAWGSSRPASADTLD